MRKAVRITLFCLLVILCLVVMCLLESARVERIVTLRLASYDASDAKAVPPHADLSQNFAVPLLIRVMQTNGFEDDFWNDYKSILLNDPKRRLADFKLYSLPILSQAVTLKQGASLLHSFDATDQRDPIILKRLANFHNALLALGMSDIAGMGNTATTLLLQIAPMLEPCKNWQIATAKAEMLEAAAMLIQKGATVERQPMLEAASDAYSAVEGALEIEFFDGVHKSIDARQKSLLLDLPLVLPFIKLSVYRPLVALLAQHDRAHSNLDYAAYMTIRGQPRTVSVSLFDGMSQNAQSAVVKIEALINCTVGK